MRRCSRQQRRHGQQKRCPSSGLVVRRKPWSHHRRESSETTTAHRSSHDATANWAFARPRRRSHIAAHSVIAHLLVIILLDLDHDGVALDDALQVRADDLDVVVACAVISLFVVSSSPVGGIDEPFLDSALDGALSRHVNAGEMGDARLLEVGTQWLLSFAWPEKLCAREQNERQHVGAFAEAPCPYGIAWT